VVILVETLEKIRFNALLIAGIPSMMAVVKKAPMTAYSTAVAPDSSDAKVTNFEKTRAMSVTFFRSARREGARFIRSWIAYYAKLVSLKKAFDKRRSSRDLCKILQETQTGHGQAAAKKNVRR
jgi:hypothetical protein